MKLLQIANAIIIVINVQIKGQSEEGIKSNCGKRLVSHEAVITNGFQSNEGAWPWHAAIFHVSTNQEIAYKCGGTVLNSNSILTAAHCVYENNRAIIPERVLVYLGIHNLKQFGLNHQKCEVDKVIPHPNYNISNLSNDIAIIRLSTEATLNNYVQAICLWESNKALSSEVKGRLGTVIGWGFTGNDKKSHILRQADMPVVSLRTCLESNRDFFENYLSDKNFCAGFLNGTNVCNGNSGGSMTFEENGVYRIRGIVSLSVSRQDKQVCYSKEYVLFTDVAKYLPWIEDVVPQLQPISPSKLGDQCSTRTSDSGVCIGLSECPVILHDLKEGKENHVVCGYDESIVCCPSTQGSNSTTARISVRKCSEYKEFAFDNVTHVSQVEPFDKVTTKESNCAFNTDSIAVGATEAKEREFPHMALIGSRNGNTTKWFCFGTLISKQFVLSGGHCAIGEQDLAEYARLGEHDRSKTDDASRVDLRIIESIPHPKYRKGSWYDDIALFKLEHTIHFNSAIRPACLPEQSAIATEKVIATGWWPWPSASGSKRNLLKYAFDVFSHVKCSSTWRRWSELDRGIVEESQFCAGSLREGGAFCNHAGVLQLQTYHKTYFCTYTIIGIHSFASMKCPYSGMPDVHTRVYAYLNWIEGIVWPNE